MRIPASVFAAPYMTRDYLKMKLVEAKEKSPYFYIVIVLVTLSNFGNKAMLEHLKKRGVFTNYWVINDDDEMLKVIREYNVDGIMTDRPSALLKIIKQESLRNKLKESAKFEKIP